MPTIVASGSLVSPGGQQGAPGPIGGGGISALLSLSGTYNLTAADSSKYVICTGGSWTLGLPAPALGMNYHVRNDMGISGVTGAITIQPASGTIDGVASLALLAGQEVRILTDGVNWRTFGRQRECVIGTQDITTSTASAFVLLPPGYRYYELDFMGVTPVVNGDNMIGQFSINGGTSWIATSYYDGGLYNPSASTAAFFDAENIATFSILPDSTSSTQQAVQGKLTIYPGNANQWPSYQSDAGGRTATSYQRKYQVYGICAQFGPVNAVKYYMPSGNIASSQLTVKGVV